MKKKVKKPSIGYRIKEARKVKGLKQKDFAKLIGLNNIVSLSRYENNITKQNLSILINIAQRCNISLDWLITGEGDMHKQGRTFKLEGERKHKYRIPSKIPLRPIPVLNTVPAGFPEEPFDDCVVDYVYIPADFKDPKAFALIVDGNSMAPKICEKDIVIISPKTKVISGQIGAFRINGEVTIKKLLKKDGKTYLIPENDEYPPIILKKGDELTAIGRAVYQLKKL